jgi:2-dehydro-3-deoxygluconokinase
LSDLLTLGEALGSLRPDAMLTAGSRVPVSVAGAESNVAIAASRLGHEVTFVGSVGDDALGRLVERTLRGEGVRTVLHRSPRPTGVILFEEPVPGRTRVDYHRRESAGTRPCLSDLEAALAEVRKMVDATLPQLASKPDPKDSPKDGDKQADPKDSSHKPETKPEAAA